jgi:hypothetical protein
LDNGRVQVSGNSVLLRIALPANKLFTDSCPSVVLIYLVLTKLLVGTFASAGICTVRSVPNNCQPVYNNETYM